MKVSEKSIKRVRESGMGWEIIRSIWKGRTGVGGYSASSLAQELREAQLGKDLVTWRLSQGCWPAPTHRRTDRKRQRYGR